MTTATAAGPAKVGPPSKLLALSELPRALAELGTLPWATPLLMTAPRGDGHPVLVIPGFITSDVSTTVLRRYLTALGHDVYAWELGRNLGPRAIGREGERLLERLERIHADTGQKVSIVGWSLGGVMARQLARRRPDAVRQVVSLGSPFAGNPRATSIWRTYQVLTGQKVDDPDTQAQLRESAEAPPVPATAIYSRTDGIVAWQNCREPEALTTENIEVHGSHCGLGVNPAVLFAVADRLARPDGDRTPFRRGGLRALLYPATRVH
jgi:pimeloyl-ACP methyl ester carboxylesterase